MASVNKSIILGNVSRDPDFKKLQNGASFCSFGVATNDKWTDKQGQKHEKAEFHSIDVYGPLADICAKYVTKGKQIYIEGRIETREWEGQDGQKKYKTAIKADNIQFLSLSQGPKPEQKPDDTFSDWD